MIWRPTSSIATRLGFFETLGQVEMSIGCKGGFSKVVGVGMSLESGGTSMTMGSWFVSHKHN